MGGRGRNLWQREREREREEEVGRGERDTGNGLFLT
jgi:hypothetical protein